MSEHVGPQPEDVEVDPLPFGTPAGWKCYHVTYKSGASAGRIFKSFFKQSVVGGHKRIYNVKDAIRFDAEQEGLDELATIARIKEYEDASKKHKAVVEEQLEDFRPEDSGLDADVLELLPPDAPPGHAAWRNCGHRPDSGGNMRVEFTLKDLNIRQQVTEKATLDNTYACFRICRALYVKAADEGFEKDQLMALRKELLDRLKGKSAGSGARKPESESKPAKRRKQESAETPTHTEQADKQSKPADEKPLATGEADMVDAMAAKDGEHAADEEAAGSSFKIGSVYLNYYLGRSGIGYWVARNAAMGFQFQVTDSKAGSADIGRRILTQLVRKYEAGATKEDLLAMRDEEYAKPLEERGGGASAAKSESKDDGENQVKDGLKDEVKKEVKEEVKKEVKEEAKEVKKEVKEEVLALVNDEERGELTDEALATLPPDAPPDSPAHTKCTWKKDHTGVDVMSFLQVKFPAIQAKYGLTVQIGMRAVFRSRHAAERIARACYVMGEKGGTKDEIIGFRTECYAKLEAAMGGKPYGAPNIDMVSQGSREKAQDLPKAQTEVAVESKEKKKVETVEAKPEAAAEDVKAKRKAETVEAKPEVVQPEAEEPGLFEEAYSVGAVRIKFCTNSKAWRARLGNKGLGTINVQATGKLNPPKGAGSNAEAQRIIEIMAKALDDGMTKDEVMAIREEEYAKLVGNAHPAAEPKSAASAEQATSKVKEEEQKGKDDVQQGKDDGSSAAEKSESSSSSESSSEKEDAEPVKEQPRKYVRAAAKMAVRTGLRCALTYELLIT